MDSLTLTLEKHAGENERFARELALYCMPSRSDCEPNRPMMVPARC